jgi:DNA replication initiation complex subunit (GINS family)
MIEIYQHFAMDTLVVDIGHKQMYGNVCISTTDKDFTVNVYDSAGKLVNQATYPVLRKLTDDEVAFVDACMSNVADIPREVVEEFVREYYNHDKFCQEYGHEYYTPLADAKGMWDDAKSYFTKESK